MFLIGYIAIIPIYILIDWTLGIIFMPIWPNEFIQRLIFEIE